jgi:hypothetical protein
MTKSSFYFCFGVPEKKCAKTGGGLLSLTITFLITDLNVTKERDFLFFPLAKVCFCNLCAKKKKMAKT